MSDDEKLIEARAIIHKWVTRIGSRVHREHWTAAAIGYHLGDAAIGDEYLADVTRLLTLMPDPQDEVLLIWKRTVEQ